MGMSILSTPKSKLITQKVNKMQLNHIITIISFFLFSTFSHAHNNTIEPEALLKLIEIQQTPLIIDVRSAQEFAQGHIQGAVNINFRSLQNDQSLNDYQNKEVILYCRSGNRAKIAAQILHKKGFQQLIDLRGHMITWQALQYPLTK